MIYLEIKDVMDNISIKNEEHINIIFLSRNVNI